MVQPIVLDHQVQNAVEERDIAPWLNGQKQITGAGNRRNARIDDDDLRAVFSRLPDVVRSDRRALSDVGSTDPDHLALSMSIHGFAARSMPKAFLLAAARAHHAEPPVVVDVRRLQTDAGEFAHQVGFLSRQARAGQNAERVVAVCGLDALNLAKPQRDRFGHNPSREIRPRLRGSRR